VTEKQLASDLTVYKETEYKMQLNFKAYIAFNDAFLAYICHYCVILLLLSLKRVNICPLLSLFCSLFLSFSASSLNRTINL
jgi:hypothetical protein